MRWSFSICDETLVWWALFISGSIVFTVFSVQRLLPWSSPAALKPCWPWVPPWGSRGLVWGLGFSFTDVSFHADARLSYLVSVALRDYLDKRSSCAAA